LTNFICIAAACIAFFGCGKTNDNMQALSSSSKHPDTWRADHRAAFQKNTDSCRGCHGTDLKGGITKVDCFNQAGSGQCHANGHGPRDVPHPLPFSDGAVHGPEAKKDLVYCQSCHGATGGPGSNPRFNVPLGSLKKGCEDCHQANAAHPVWKATSGLKGHATAGNLGNSCYLCHLSGGVGRECSACHTSSPSGTIPTLGVCVSCHAKPPSSGNHAKHNALTGVKDVCATCHTGAGSGTAKHADGTKDVVFAGSYNAKSGLAIRNADGSCANVSCHGGVKTPAWGGSLSVGCLSCHTSGTAQFNSYNSGQHVEHINGVGLQCTDCHDMSKTSGTMGHYSGLGTPAFELAPSVTIRVPGYTATNPSCSPGVTPAAGDYSVTVCHATRGW
jgi:predicted CxxxxCH...CXXCH cytochrome family protein